VTGSARKHAPETRTVKVRLEPPFEGWEAEVKANFKAKYWADLNNGDPDRILPALDRIVISHNFLDEETGEPAEKLEDVDLDALTALITRFGEEVAKLPPR